MEALAILAIILIILPLPLCIYLIVQRNRDVKRIQKLEEDVRRFRSGKQREAATKEAMPPPLPREESVETRAAASTETPSKPLQTSESSSAKPKIVFYNEEEGPPKSTTPSEPHGPPPIIPTHSRLVSQLRSIGLWPPEDAASAEAGLMQWWLPRIGGLLATLSVIYFAVYISQGTPPWVRFVELLIADGLVLGAGFYFLKKRPKFGSTLTATGLTMLYLTSVAAYAAPQVRVIENPFIGIAIQFAVVALIFIASLRLDNRNIAIMALIYGFVSSLFSSYVASPESSLISALALYLTGIVFSRKFDWLPILSISTVGAYLPVFSFCILEVIGSSTLTLPHLWSVIGYLLISVSLLPLCDYRWKLAESFPRLTVLHAINTTACLAVGYLYVSLFTTELVLFYGRATLVFAGWALLFGLRNCNSYLFQLFFLKASALAALWLVNRYEGDIRWFALMVEAVLVCWVAARSKSLLQEGASSILWLVSLFYAVKSIGIDKLEIAEFSWFLYLAHPLVAAGMLAYLRQCRVSDGRASGFYILAALVNGVAGIAFVSLSDVTRDVLPLITVLYGTVLCCVGLTPRFSRLIPATSGALLVFAANIQFWDQPDNEWSFICVTVISFGLAYCVARANAKLFRTGTLLAFVELVFHIAWITSVFAYTANAFQSYSFFPFFPALFALLLLAVPTGPLKALRDASFVPLLLFSLYAPTNSLTSIGRVLVLIAYLAALFLPNLRPALISSFYLLRRWQVWRTLHHALIALISTRVLFEIESWIVRVLAMLLLSGAFHFLWRIHKRYVGLILSFYFVGLSFVSILSIWDSSVESVLRTLPWAKEALLGGLLTVALALAFGIDHAKSGHRRLTPTIRQLLVYLTALFGYAVYAVTLSTDLLWAQSSYTPLMALFCLILVGIGIGAKIKPYRMVALVGFALPVFRLFAYDIRDTLIRIIAFAILAVLITFVGYLYHRFQSRIE